MSLGDSMIHSKDIFIFNEKKDVTSKLQNLIDKYDDIIIDSGTYLVSSLFIKSNKKIKFDNVIIKGTDDESKYKLINTRVAGIEMDWYPAIINIIDSSNVEISGNLDIIGAGEYFYNKYWGLDTLGGMRKDYDKKGLRWACDYDCKRVRNVLIQNSSNIKIADMTLRNSGFWNMHILYSNDVVVENVKVYSDSKIAPSTDGIDVDSSYNIKLSNLILSTNDDNISIKSGRDFDGIRVNRPSHDISINNCRILKGYGITIGSEVSGGVYNVDIKHIKCENTSCGFRIKSSKPRKGYIRNIKVEDVELTNVKYAFHLFLNWNPAYSICKIPSNYKGEIPPFWNTLTKNVDDNISNTKVSNITFNNIYGNVERIFTIYGFDDVNISDLEFNNIKIDAKEYGIINNTNNLKYNNVILNYKYIHLKENDDFDNR